MIKWTARSNCIYDQTPISVCLLKILDDIITLYVTTNGSNYQVRRNSSSSSRDWSDQFSFNASLEPNQTFNYPIYVFSAGGSPYWRQYISTNPSPPSGEYRTDYVFYVSSVPVVRSMAYYVLDSGNVPVIKSCISKTAQLTGWRSTGIVFYALKPTRAGTPTRRKSTVDTSLPRVSPSIRRLCTEPYFEESYTAAAREYPLSIFLKLTSFL
jgi:hypothetical protein